LPLLLASEVLLELRGSEDPLFLVPPCRVALVVRCLLLPECPFLLVLVVLAALPPAIEGPLPGLHTVVPLSLEGQCRWVPVVLLSPEPRFLAALPQVTEVPLLVSEVPPCPVVLQSLVLLDSVVLAALPPVPCPGEESLLEWEEDNRIFCKFFITTVL